MEVNGLELRVELEWLLRRRFGLVGLRGKWPSVVMVVDEDEVVFGLLNVEDEDSWVLEFVVELFKWVGCCLVLLMDGLIDDGVDDIVLSRML